MTAPMPPGRATLRGVLIGGAFLLAVAALAGPSSGFVRGDVATVLGLGAVGLFLGALLSLRPRPRDAEPDGERLPSQPVPLPHWSPAPGVVPDVVLRPGGPEPTLEPEAVRAPVDTPPPDPEDPTVDVFPAPPEAPDRDGV